jgi:hypothetical protein
MNGERDPRVPRAGGAGERLAQQRLAVALVLELGLKRDAQLRRDRIDRPEPRAMGKHAHPAGSGIDAVDDRDDAAVGLAAPALGIDAHGRRLKDLDRPQRRRRRIPKRHMEPVPQSVLIGRNEWTEAEQWGSHEFGFGRCGVRGGRGRFLTQSRALPLAASGSRRRIDDKAPLTLGGEREALEHVLVGELGERLEQVFLGHACGQMAKHLADRDARALDARLAEANRRIDRDSWERRHVERVARA